MTVSYGKDQHNYAKAHGLHLITVDACGVNFQGPVDRKTERALLQWLTNNVFKKQQAATAVEDEGC